MVVYVSFKYRAKIEFHKRIVGHHCPVTSGSVILLFYYTAKLQDKLRLRRYSCQLAKKTIKV